VYKQKQGTTASKISGCRRGWSKGTISYEKDRLVGCRWKVGNEQQVDREVERGEGLYAHQTRKVNYN
jgi:hypothetical protein